MTAFAYHYRPGQYRPGTRFPLLSRIVLVAVVLLLAAWIAWVSFFAALIALPIVFVATLIARFVNRPAGPRPTFRSDPPVIEGEYHVIPPER
jgi:hypothetical protein